MARRSRRDPRRGPRGRVRLPDACQGRRDHADGATRPPRPRRGDGHASRPRWRCGRSSTASAATRGWPSPTTPASTDSRTGPASFWSRAERRSTRARPRVARVDHAGVGPVPRASVRRARRPHAEHLLLGAGRDRDRGRPRRELARDRCNGDAADLRGAPARPARGRKSRQRAERGRARTRKGRRLRRATSPHAARLVRRRRHARGRTGDRCDRAEEGVELRVPAGTLPDGGRRAGLTSHWFMPRMVGQEQRIHTGWVDANRGKVVYRPHTSRRLQAPCVQDAHDPGLGEPRDADAGLAQGRNRGLSRRVSERCGGERSSRRRRRGAPR